MSRIELVICDQCGNEITEDGPYATIGVPGESEWEVKDLCSKGCTYDFFNLGDEDTEEAVVALAEEEPVKAKIRLKPVDDEAPTFDPDQSVENEKRFSDAADELSTQMTGVTSRTRRR